MLAIMSFPFQIFHTRKHAAKLILIEQKSEHKIHKLLQNELLSSLCAQQLFPRMRQRPLHNQDRNTATSADGK